MQWLKIFLFFIFSSVTLAQIHQFPYRENFDTVIVPLLPAGWLSTTHRLSSGDFTTTTSTSHSDSNAVLSSNATISQTLISPTFNFSGMEPDSLSFYERCSGSYNSGVILEASISDGSSFPIQVSDTIKNPGTTSYVPRKFKLPFVLGNQPAVVFQWRVIGNGTGTTGTIRFDDIVITAKAQFDIGVTALQAFPEFPRSGDSVEFLATAKNEGTMPIQNIEVNFYEDLNNDSLPELSERIASRLIRQTLYPGDTTEVQARLADLSSGEKTIFVIANFTGDQNPANDTLRFTVHVNASRNSIIINEIMYEPKSGGSEYIELFNRSMEKIDLKGWKLSDRRDSSGKSNEFLISKSTFVVESGEFLVVAADSGITMDFPYLVDRSFHVVSEHTGSLSLNNNGDDVILLGFNGMCVDSIRYSPDWHNPELTDVSGRSLERINPNLPGNDKRNWSTSADPRGGTPGKQNSIYTLSPQKKTGISFSPNPFSPDGNGNEDVTIMTYQLPAMTALIRVRVFDVQGRLIRTLADGEPSGARGELIWDGYDDNRNRAHMGIYTVLLEAIDASGAVLQIQKGAVVVAARM